MLWCERSGVYNPGVRAVPSRRNVDSRESLPSPATTIDGYTSVSHGRKCRECTYRKEIIVFRRNNFSFLRFCIPNRVTIARALLAIPSLLCVPLTLFLSLSLSLGLSVSPALLLFFFLYRSLVPILSFSRYYSLSRSLFCSFRPFESSVSLYFSLPLIRRSSTAVA